jgi:UDP-3-O-acyl-N-acetylglucosamine deacetylase
MVTDEVEVQQGAFKESLYRNNSKIRKDRADSIIEDAEIIYKREIEDLDVQKKKMLRDQENMLDLSPTDALSLTLASDFDSKVYVDKDIELGVKIRNVEIKLEIARKRYAYLFGGTE